MSRSLGARAFAAGAVVVALAALRALGCSSSGCDLSGFCCCSGDTVGAPLCGVYGPYCVQGLALYAGGDCNTKCHVAADAQAEASAETSIGDGGDGDTTTCSAGDACCCAGDVLDFPQCTDGGQISCRAGYGLYRGDDCRCLPDRNTPCCLTHPLIDAGAGG